MTRFLLLLLLWCNTAWATSFTDLTFGRYQIADSQWNVSACTTTSTCQIYSTNPGTMYKIPWYNGQWNWQTGQYVKFVLTGNATNPYEGRVYNSNGTLAGVIGTGHIVNMGVDASGKALFFFVGNDNNTGQLFSANYGFAGTGGYTWTGTLNPTVAQVDSFAASYGTTTPLASGQTYTAAPSLCCGGSSSAFTPDSTHTIKLNTFNNRGTADSRVYVEQIGNDNTININQTGTRNNSVTYTGNGSFNSIDVTQSSTSPTATNYTEVTVNGNSNNIDLIQNSTGGTKSAFVTVSDNNNTVNINQKDSGNHYLNLNLSGGNKSADILQQGAGNHQADITLTGAGARSINLIQQGTTAQSYSINSSCASNCQTISVTQGQ